MSLCSTFLFSILWTTCTHGTQFITYGTQFIIHVLLFYFQFCGLIAHMEHSLLFMFLSTVKQHGLIDNYM